MKQLSLTEFYELEQNFADCIKYIPNTAEHENVWSPKFATIILNSCSIIDSILRVKSNDDITNYYNRISKDVSLRWAVFWGVFPTLIDPFKKWRNTKTYRPLLFWNSYNKIKHDRYKNLKLATLSNALESLGALLIIIVRNPDLVDSIIQAEIINANESPLKPLVGCRSASANAQDEEFPTILKISSSYWFANKRIEQSQKSAPHPERS